MASQDEIDELRRQLRQARNDHRIVAEQLRRYEQSRSARLIGKTWALERRLRDQAITLRYKLRRAQEKFGPAIGRTGQSGLPVTAVPSAPSPVTVPASASPTVSIVIPVHGHQAVTARCLESIAANSRDVPIEVIVVDDASNDGTRAWLNQCEGIRILELDENVGYLRATNAGAELAQGRYICLLNNDVVVSSNWLEPLVRTLDTHPRVGAVGPMLTYPNGEVQEAGSIIWSDGTGHNVGRGEAPSSAHISFAREVDYCSAACLLVRSRLWHQLGGYDDRFAPAYYEDTDLAFRLRRAGYTIQYQPHSMVTHLEGVSHGTSTATGTKAYQEVNRVAFAEQHRAALSKQRPPKSNIDKAAWRGGEVIVIATDKIPMHDTDSGSLRMRSILELLVGRGHRVVLAATDWTRREPYATQLEDLGVRIAPTQRDLGDVLSTFGDECVCLIASRPPVGAFASALLGECDHAIPLVYDMVDYHHRRLDREATAAGRTFAPQDHPEVIHERELLNTCTLAIAISEEEAAHVRSDFPETRVAVLPNVHDAPVSTTPFADRNGLLFVGNYFHAPNRDAVHWLLEEIMPIVWKSLPEMMLHIVGGNMSDSSMPASDERVIVHGWVPYLDDLFDRALLNVAPLRYGAGLKGKVGDALVRGLPTVATSIAAEGFEGGTGLLPAADSAAEFAELICALHEDEALWSERSRQGRAFVLEHFGTEATAERIDELLSSLHVRTTQ